MIETGFFEDRLYGVTSVWMYVHSLAEQSHKLIIDNLNELWYENTINMFFYPI